MFQFSLDPWNGNDGETIIALESTNHRGIGCCKIRMPQTPLVGALGRNFCSKIRAKGI